MADLRQTHHRILRQLLDRYERSTAYGRTAPWRRDVILRVSAEEFPEAFDPSGATAMADLCAACADLAKARAVRLRHDKHFPTERPLEIRMGGEEVAQAYALAEAGGYVPLSVEIDEIQAAATALAATRVPEWMAAFLNRVASGERTACLDALAMRPERFKRDAADIRAALQAAAALSQGMEGWERVVSERIFGDSKRLGAIRSVVGDLLRRADPAWQDLTVEDSGDILEAYGILRKPGVIRCAGAVPLVVGGRGYALEDFTPTAHLPEDWGAAWVEGLAKARPTIVTTIENEFPFLSYVLEAGGPTHLGHRSELVVFTGGFPSATLRKHLVAAASALPGTIFQHWGDADLGGMRIWWFLRNMLGRPLDVFRTDASWFRKEVGQRGQPLTKAEEQGLVRLRRELESSKTDAGDVISAIELIAALLEHGRKIEQERY